MLSRANILPAIGVSKLSEEELNNPFIVIHELFDWAHFWQIRPILWDLFKATITGSYSKRYTKKERFDIVTLYEHIEKLIEAVHVINEQNKLNKKHLSKDVSKIETPVVHPFLPENLKPNEIEAICNKISFTETGSFERLIYKIVQVTNAEKIFFVEFKNSATDKVEFDFLALLPGGAQFKFKEYQELIEKECNSIGSVILWCSHLGEVYKLLKKGHIFYSIVCTRENLVYDNGRVPLPKANEFDTTVIIERTKNLYNEIFTTAKSFLHGARYYSTIEQQKTAAFMLHQATEHALRALLFSVTTYNTFTHNLTVLFRHCNYCAPELAQIFPQDTDKEKTLFRLLNIAYVHTRYKSKYEISDDELMMLLDRVDHLQIEVQQFFDERLITFQKPFESVTANS